MNITDSTQITGVQAGGKGSENHASFPCGSKLTLQKEHTWFLQDSLKDLGHLVNLNENSSVLHSFYSTFCFADLKKKQQKNIICSLPQDPSSNIVSERAIKSELKMNCGAVFEMSASFLKLLR